MGAISATVMQLCKPSDHVVVSNTIYGGTFALFKEFLPQKTGLQVSFVDICDHEAVEKAFRKNTRLLYLETVANPTLAVADIPLLAEMTHRHNAVCVVDNTFTPLMVTPSQHGADIIIHSLTKFINGASDIIAGAICARQEFIIDLMDLHCGSLMLLGPTMDPTVAFKISLRLPHLALRMTEHSRRAQVFAERLAEAKVPVVYPGLTSHPQHAILKKLANPEFGCGGLLCVDMGERARAHEFMEILQNKDRFGFIAVSLGYFETLMSCSASSTSISVPGGRRLRDTR